MGPLAVAALLGGAAFLYTKMKKPAVINQSNVPIAQTSGAVDSQSGLQFMAQPSMNGLTDVFLMPSGTRIVRFDQNTMTEITSPDGTDPSIKAAALRAFGVRPKQ